MVIAAGMSGRRGGRGGDVRPDQLSFEAKGRTSYLVLLLLLLLLLLLSTNTNRKHSSCLEKISSTLFGR